MKARTVCRKNKAISDREKDCNDDGPSDSRVDDLVRPILADDCARVAVMVERLERKIRELKTSVTIAGYELLDLKIELREAVAALESHDAREWKAG